MDMHEKMAFVGAGLLKGLGSAVARYFSKHPVAASFETLGLGIGALGPAMGGMKGFDTAAAAMSPDKAKSIKAFGQSFAKSGSIDGNIVYSDVVDYITKQIDPIQGVKYAMMMLCDNSDHLLKLAKVDHKAATYSAMTKLAETLNRFPEPDEDALDEDEKKDVAKVVEFKHVSKPSLKKAMVLLKASFPELYADSNAKIAFLAYLTCPDVMVKTSYFQTAPTAFARFGIPIAAISALASAVLGAGVTAQAASNQVSKLTSYAKLTEVDPELKNYPEQHVKKIIYDLYKVAPDVMKNDTLASHIVHQLAASPPGGVSIDYADKLLRAQEQLNPGYSDKFIKVLGPASSIATKVLDVF